MPVRSKTNKLNIYKYELTKGKYRNMTKINENFKMLGIDIDRI